MKDSCPSPTKMLKEEEANKKTQRKMHSDVVLMKLFLPNENETWQLRSKTYHRQNQILTSADFYCLWEKSPVMNMSQQHSEEFVSLLWSVIWKPYATASLLLKDNVRQLNCSRGTCNCLSESLNLETTLWFSLCGGFDNERRVATLPNLIHIRVNR